MYFSLLPPIFREWAFQLPWGDPMEIFFSELDGALDLFKGIGFFIYYMTYSLHL